MKRGLSRTRQNLVSGLGDLLLGKVDDTLLEALEDRLISADVGIEVSEQIIDDLKQGISRKEFGDPQALINALQTALVDLLKPFEGVWQHEHKPHLTLMVGVNGAGKTTTIGKLAKHLQKQQVILAAGDTFRAAAVEQLQTWGERNQIPVVAQHTGADSASVIYDAFAAAQAKQYDVLLADTAGRLHTQSNLMQELQKIIRVMKKLDATAPHDVFLVLDASMGQNALRQAEEFHQAVGVTGIILTKLDGTAKGGIIFAIAQRLKLPIYFIGVG